MSEIKKLIERLCPDGVEYKKLEEIADITIGEFVHKNKQNPMAPYPVYNGGTTYTGFYDNYNNEGNKIVISARGYAGFVNRVFDKYWAGNSSYTIAVNSPHIIWHYVYYYLKNEQYNIMSMQQKGGGVPAISKKQIQEIEIPVPPIEVQSKIVEYLDNFTELEAKLEAELEAELEGRRKQYEYYRNQLLTFDKDKGARFDVKWMKLGEIGEMIKGSGIQKSDFVEDGYPCIHYGQLHTFFGTFADKNKSFIKKDLYDRCKKAVYGDLIIASTSEDVEACCKATAWLGGEVAISGDAHIFHHNQNPKYIAYFFQTDDFAKQKRKYASGVKVVRVSSDNLAKIVIPIPPLEEQQRIVSILDRFEALTTDLQSGLPAEIEARRKQYEYYREQLLTFKRKTA